jgi:glycerophosphoryl diester phosphodiesterase
VLIKLKYYGHQRRLEERVAKSVTRADMDREVATMSLDWNGVQRMRELRPDWPAGVLTARAVGDLATLDADFLAVAAGMFTPSLLWRAYAAGQQVFVWTVNTPELMRSFVLRGADGLITDRPEVARGCSRRWPSSTPPSASCWPSATGSA